MAFIAAALLLAISTTLSAPAISGQALPSNLLARDVSSDPYTAGVWIHAPADDNPFTKFSASFTLPTVSSTDGPAGAVAIIAINDVDANGRLFSVGCLFATQASDDTPAYACLYTWISGQPTIFHDFNPRSGDTLTLSLALTSSTSGTAGITNARSGEIVSTPVNAPDASSTIAGKQAIIAVQAPSEGIVKGLPQFDLLDFTGVIGTAKDGKTKGATGADLLNMAGDGNNQLAVVVASDSEVKFLAG